MPICPVVFNASLVAHVASVEAYTPRVASAMLALPTY